jgi:hypothetical protein
MEHILVFVHDGGIAVCLDQKSETGCGQTTKRVQSWMHDWLEAILYFYNSNSSIDSIRPLQMQIRVLGLT